MILRRRFRPEFLNRLDDIIIFHSLTKKEIEKIVELQINRVNDRLKKKDLFIELDDSAKKHLVEIGFDPVYGARPLKRTIQTEILDELALRIIEGKFKKGKIRVGAKGGKIVFK